MREKVRVCVISVPGGTREMFDASQSERTTQDWIVERS